MERISDTTEDTTSAKSSQQAKTPESGDSKLEQVVAWFEDAEEATKDARKDAEIWRDYYDDKQLTPAEIARLNLRGQPIIVKNHIKRKINFLVGFEATQRTDPKAFPRTPDDEDASYGATDMLRFQEEANELDQKFSDVWEEMLIEGYGGVEVLGLSPKNPNVIEVKLWHYDRLFYDPYSREHDFRDATYLGGMVWMDQSKAEAAFPQQAKEGVFANLVSEYTSNIQSNAKTYEDRPHQQWVKGGKRFRVRIVQMYYKEGDQWFWCLFTKGGWLDGGAVEFQDEDGMPDCPLILQSAYVDRENNRYGAVKELIGLQDEINKRSSKALHAIMVNGFITEEGVVDDIDAVKIELAKPDGGVVLRPGGMDRFKVRENETDITGNLQLLEAAQRDMEVMGPNAAMQGKQGDSASGKAIRASQEGGVIEMARLRDRHTQLKRRVYRAIWNRVRQFVTDETWIRVTDDEENIRFVGFNRPVTAAEDELRKVEKEDELDLDDQTMKAKIAEFIQQRPEGATVVRYDNVPVDMDMDIRIENATESVNIQEEQFAQLVELAGTGVQMPPEVYIKASSLRNKEELLEAISGGKEAKAAQAQQAEQQAAMIQKQLEEMDAKIQALQAKADKDRVSAVGELVTTGLDAAYAMSQPEPGQMPQQAQPQQAGAQQPQQPQQPAGPPVEQPMQPQPEVAPIAQPPAGLPEGF